MKWVSKTLRRLAGAWLLWRIAGPEIQRNFGHGQVRPLRMSGRSVFVGEFEMFVREAGPTDGHPLILVHGWSLDGEMTFHRLVPELSDRFRIIVPDHRNHGRSEWVRGRFEISDLAHELAGVLDGLGVSGATVFGWSMGGMTTLELARNRPDLVSRMILGGTAARPVPAHRPAARVLFLAGRALMRVSRHEVAAASDKVLVDTGSLAPKHRSWMQRGLLRRDPTLYYEAGNALWRFDARKWVGRLDVPSLVVIPTSDQLIPPKAQYELASLLPGTEIVELVDGRHEAVLNRTEELAKLIETFVP